MKNTTTKKPLVCAFYFPNWHVDPRNEKWHGSGWTEWEVVKCARPRFPGHQQPKVPLWGYEDESDPQAMDKKIDAAITHGIDGFIFDWYWFSDGPYRTNCLENGFLKAPKAQEMKFAIMWANHDPIYTHPGSRMYRTPQLLDGSTSPETFRQATDHCIKNYFQHPNYLRVNGKLYFSIFTFERMVENLGGEIAAKALFRDFRHRVAAAGLGELAIDAMVNTWHTEEFYSMLERLDVDSCSTYNWSRNHEHFPTCNYDEAANNYIAANHELTAKCRKIPYNPCVAMGWDVSPRSVQSEIYENLGYPFENVMYATPAQFEAALRNAHDFFLSGKATGNLITINAWNEWTEGAYLEPDELHRMGFLEAVKNVFQRGR